MHGELLLTIMSSLAQEESRSISENARWGKRKAMADGKISEPWSSVLGYEKSEDGLPKIVPDQAEVIRLIYKLFMDGKTYTAIAKELTERGIKSPKGKDEWGKATVRSILQNELYRGSKELQKQFCTNYLTKHYKDNEGELPKYWIEESHEAIIPPEEFDAVQAEIARRKEQGINYKAKGPLSRKIICGDCGGVFGSKVWNSTSQKYRKVIWRRNQRYSKKGKRNCQTSHVVESEVKYRFITAYNKLMADKSDIIDNCETAIAVLSDTSEIEAEIKALEEEVEVVEGLAMQAIDDNKRQVIDQSEWMERNGKYIKRHENATERLKELDKQKADAVNKVRTIRRFVTKIRAGADVLTEWD